MAVEDRLTEGQRRYIYSLADRAFEEDREHFGALVERVYGVRPEELNRGQASMLIDDLRYELGEEGAEEPEYASLFDLERG